MAEKIRGALGRELKRDPKTITLEQRLGEDLGVNSLDAIELMFRVEEEFDVEIPDADLPALRTVGDLVSYVEARLAGAPSPAAAAMRPPAATSAPAAPAVNPPRAASAKARTRRAGRTPPRVAKRSRG